MNRKTSPHKYFFHSYLEYFRFVKLSDDLYIYEYTWLTLIRVKPFNYK